MMKRLLYIFLFFSSLHGIAQVNLDSLWTVWGDAKQLDTIRLQAMQRICLQGYLYSKPDTAEILGKEMEEFAILKNEKHYQIFALQVQGTSCSLRADNIRAIDFFTKALKIAEEIHIEVVSLSLIKFTTFSLKFHSYNAYIIYLL